MIRKIFFCLSLLILTPILLFSLSKTDLNKRYRIHLKNLFQNRTILFSGEVNSYQSRIKGPFQTQIIFHPENGTIDVSYKASFYSQKVYMDNSFRVLYSDTRYFVDSKIAKEIYGYDRRELINVTNFNRSILIYYFKGKMVKKNMINFDENTVDEDALFLLLQSALIDGKTNFSADVLLASLGLKLTFDFKVKTTKNLSSVSLDFSYPQSFLLSVGNQPKEAYVWKITLGGMAGMFYNQKHYLAFEKEYPYRFIASWGGDQKNAEFIYQTNSK